MGVIFDFFLLIFFFKWGGGGFLGLFLGGGEVSQFFSIHFVLMSTENLT